jgi:hypothetical protein
MARPGSAWQGGARRGTEQGNKNQANREEAKMRKYQVTLTGVSDMLHHQDNILWGERVRKWQKDPANKALSVPGDDRSPAWTWIGCLYEMNRKVVVVDADNIMAALRDGGTKVPAAKGRGSLKAATQSGILVNELGWPLLVDGREIPYQPILALADELDFEKHEALAESLGFELFLKRAKIGTAKHIRVRPRFSNWAATGSITVSDPQLNTEVLQSIFAAAGRYAGIGDWRPGSPSKPGQFGQFLAELTEIEE